MLAEPDGCAALASSQHPMPPDTRTRIETHLERARKPLETRRAHATALLYQCIVELDELMEARTTDQAADGG